MGDNDGDYPTSMSLATLGPSTLPKTDSKLLYLDRLIQQSQSDIAPPKRQIVKEYQLNDVSDIPGATASKTRIRSSPSNTLRVDDIEGAKGRVRDKFLFTQRHVNPLIPDYNLPTYEPSAPYVPKFLRDSMSVDDIEGAKPKPKKTPTVRDILNVSDIEGAHANWRPFHQRARLEAPPHDVNFPIDNLKNKKFTDRTTRVTNPAAPQYYIHGIEIEDDKYSKPKPLKKPITDSSLLKTIDIEGAQAGFSSDHLTSIPSSKRTEFRNTNFLGDIKGAQADSVKHSIVTNRVTNPLQPTYPALDPGEVIQGPIVPLIPDTIVDPKKSLKVLGKLPRAQSGRPPIHGDMEFSLTGGATTSQYFKTEGFANTVDKHSTSNMHLDLSKATNHRNSKSLADSGRQILSTDRSFSNSDRRAQKERQAEIDSVRDLY